MRPSHRLRVASAQRDRLLASAFLTGDELLRIDDWLQGAIGDLDEAFRLGESRQRERPVADMILDSGTWLLGIATFAACLLDYSDHHETLERAGWIELILACVTLVFCAATYQRRKWELDEAEDEAEALLQTLDVLQEIMALLMMRF